MQRLIQPPVRDSSGWRKNGRGLILSKRGVWPRQGFEVIMALGEVLPLPKQQSQPWPKVAISPQKELSPQATLVLSIREDPKVLLQGLRVDSRVHF